MLCWQLTGWVLVGSFSQEDEPGQRGAAAQGTRAWVNNVCCCTAIVLVGLGLAVAAVVQRTNLGNVGAGTWVLAFVAGVIAVQVLAGFGFSRSIGSTIAAVVPE